MAPPSSYACSDVRLSVAFCGVVAQHVDPAEQLEGGLDRGFSVGGDGDVELDCQQALVGAYRLLNSLGTAAGGDHLVTSGKRRLGEVHTYTTPGTSNKPYLLVHHKASIMSQ